jgi:D-alanyl-D-alanine carboxypeptidase
MKAAASFLVFVVIAMIARPAAAFPSDTALRPPLLQILGAYLRARATAENLSAVSLSISFPNRAQNLNLVVGRTTFRTPGAPVTPANLFQIGSITKSFTSATILQLEAEGKLSIDQTVGQWLPQYPAWRGVTIRRLLNMTSGIYSYDNTQAMMREEGKDIHRRWTPPVLIGTVDPTYGNAPPPTSGWSYSNTNYLLAGMIIERATHHPYEEEIARRFFGPKLGLRDTYYSPNVYPAPILARMVSGYFFNSAPSDLALAPLIGEDMKTNDMSWAGAAGGIVARPEDVTHWVRALYRGTILAPKQRAELLSVVSMKTGKPILRTTLSDPRGFGLGVGQSTRPGIGLFWFYQGETLGYRVLYGWFPKQDLVIALGANSAPLDRENQLGPLLEQVYTAVVKQRT